MIKRRHRRDKEVNTELNITAFMNLMVVLIPFLLLTAVFSQVSVLKLNLPSTASGEPPEDKLVLNLEVILRPEKIVLNERTNGVIAEFPLSQETAFIQLNQALQTIKARVEDTTTITILAEPDTAYDMIIRTMDAVRMIPTEAEPIELFPDVSIGSAPLASSSARGDKS
jgi:biopolymer transport protein ExbD